MRYDAVGALPWSQACECLVAGLTSTHLAFGLPRARCLDTSPATRHSYPTPWESLGSFLFLQSLEGYWMVLQLGSLSSCWRTSMSMRAMTVTHGEAWFGGTASRTEPEWCFVFEFRSWSQSVHNEDHVRAQGPLLHLAPVHPRPEVKDRFYSYATWPGLVQFMGK